MSRTAEAATANKSVDNRARRGALNNRPFSHGQGQFFKNATSLCLAAGNAGVAICAFPQDGEEEPYD